MKGGRANSVFIEKDPLLNIMLNITYNRPRACLTIVSELPNSVQNRLNNEQKQPKISLLRTREGIEKEKQRRN